MKIPWWGFLGHLCFRRLKIPEIMIWNSRCDSQFIVSFRKSINLKLRFDPFLYIQNNFLQHIVRDIDSDNITVYVQRESRQCFRHAQFRGMFIQSIPVFLFPYLSRYIQTVRYQKGCYKMNKRWRLIFQHHTCLRFKNKC